MDNLTCRDKTRAIRRLVGILVIACFAAPYASIIVKLSAVFIPLVRFTYGFEKTWWFVSGLLWNTFTVGVILAGVIGTIKSLREIRAIWVKNNKQLAVLCTGTTIIVAEIFYEVALSFASPYDPQLFLRPFGDIRIWLVTWSMFLLTGCLIYALRDKEPDDEQDNK